MDKKSGLNSKISRRDFLATAGSFPLALGAGLSACSGNNIEKDKPNILIVITDQLSQKAVGCYGDNGAARIDFRGAGEFLGKLR